MIRAAGGYTAWSDKHQAYDWTNGPSGKGVDDLYSPEVNSLIKNGGNANGVNLTATLPARPPTDRRLRGCPTSSA